MLAFYYLTSKQLDDLAVYFYQLSPLDKRTECYLYSIDPWLSIDPRGDITIKDKRRRFSLFIGLFSVYTKSKLSCEDVSGPYCAPKSEI